VLVDEPLDVVDAVLAEHGQTPSVVRTRREPALDRLADRDVLELDLAR